MSTPQTTSSGPTGAAASAPARPLRIRYARTAYFPLLVGTVCAVPLAASLGAWGLLLAIPFVLAAIALARIGADITAQRVVVRSALSSRVIARDELTGFTVPDGRHVHLLRRDGSTVRIPTARPRDLPRLRELLFGDLPGTNLQPTE